LKEELQKLNKLQEQSFFSDLKS